MIEIELKSGMYLALDLYNALSKYFDTGDSINIFIESMIKTKQIIPTIGGYELPGREEYVFPSPRNFQADIDIIAGGTRTGEQRLGFREGWERATRVGIPETFMVTSIIKDGKLIPIYPQDRVISKTVTRRQSRREAWRGEVPAHIRRDYNVQLGDKLRYTILMAVKRYYTKLQLWGMSHKIIWGIDYKSPRGHVYDRRVELIGSDFIREFFSRDLADEMSINIVKVENITKAALERADRDYLTAMENMGSNLLGDQTDPLSEYTERITEISLYDYDARKEKINMKTRRLFSEFPEPIDFTDVTTKY